MSETKKVEPNQVENDDFPAIEPCAESVSGSELANVLESTFSKYVFLPDGAATSLALWVLHTYAPDLFDYTPRICISSPEPRCGKTTLLTLLEFLSQKSLNVSNITAAAMFRTIEKYSPTLLIDEADTFLQDNGELRGVINAGFQRNGRITRIECIGRRHETRFFKCFTPVSIAAIGNIPTTIRDRSIVINMRRKSSTDQIERIRTRDLRTITNELQKKCARFMFDNSELIATQRPEIPNWFNDRAADLWEPLLAIANVLSDEWGQKALNAAKLLTKSTCDNEPISTRTQLLQDIKHIFAGREFMASTILVEELNNIEGSPWGEWAYSKGLSVHSLAGQLKYFNIAPRQSRIEGLERSRKYYLSDFADAFNRYLPNTQPDCAIVPADKNPNKALTGTMAQFNQTINKGIK